MGVDMKKLLATTALIASVTAGAANAGEWNGAYAGVFATHLTPGNNTGVGIQLGYNIDQGNLVYGGEVDFSKFAAGSLAEIHGRIGTKLGSNVLGFGLLGLGMNTSGSPRYWVAGVGAEYQFSQGWGLRADLSHLQIFGGASSNNIRLGVVRNF